jgi:hypothetical protein
MDKGDTAPRTYSSVSNIYTHMHIYTYAYIYVLINTYYTSRHIYKYIRICIYSRGGGAYG